MTRDEAKPILLKHLGRETLTADDFPHGPVTVSLYEGSFFCWYDAFYLLEGDAIYIFTEHWGYHEFERDQAAAFFGPEAPKAPAPPAAPTA